MAKPMISVITPTVRPEGLHLVAKALGRQTFRDFEWIVVSSNTEVLNLRGQRASVKGESRTKIIKDPEKQERDVWTLNKAYNAAIKEAEGELIVSWQDWTFAKPDALEKYWYHYQSEPKTIVSGVGGKYEDDTWAVQTWKDPRERDDQGSFYQCYFNDIEGNFCSVPRAAFYSVGGFDESLDAYYGMDFFSVLDRLNLIGGWDFKLDQSNKSYSFEHGRPKGWEEKNAIHIYKDKIRPSYIDNPILSYLK